MRQPNSFLHTHVYTCLPGYRPAVCSCTRSCQLQCSSVPLPGDWTRQSFPLPPLEKRKEIGEREIKNKSCTDSKPGGRKLEIKLKKAEEDREKKRYRD